MTKTIDKIETSKILKCDCANKTQDEFYGKGMRLCNRIKQGQGNKFHEWRCTVCLKIHATNPPKVEVKEDKKNKK